MTTCVQVSFQYWAFAFRFISEPKNRARLPSAASHFFGTDSLAAAESDKKSSLVGPGLKGLADQGSTRPRGEAADARHSESQVTSLVYAVKSGCNNSLNQLAALHALFSKARHDRLDALVQILDTGSVHRKCKAFHSKNSTLTQQQVSVDAVDEHGNTVLIVSAQNNNKRICKAVLRRGANIHHQNRMGQTCLHFAFSLGYTKLGEYLLSKGGSETLRNT